jgi:hypothetical protein
MRTRMLVGCVAALALGAGCVSAPARKVNVRVVDRSELASQKVSPDKTYVCEEGKKAGSQIPGTVCQTLRAQELEREATQEQIRRMSLSGFQRP